MKYKSLIVKSRAKATMRQDVPCSGGISLHLMGHSKRATDKRSIPSPFRCGLISQTRPELKILKVRQKEGKRDKEEKKKKQKSAEAPFSFHARTTNWLSNQMNFTEMETDMKSDEFIRFPHSSFSVKSTRNRSQNSRIIRIIDWFWPTIKQSEVDLLGSFYKSAPKSKLIQIIIEITIWFSC